MLLLGALGVDPWDVFHQGLSRRIGLGVGTWALIVSGGVLVLWVPLRQRPGLGTISNAILIGLTIDAMLALFHTPHALILRWLLMIGGVLLNGVATGFYIGAGLGPGPRDGLMMGWAARGHQIRVVRTCIELTVFAAGWALGGNVGIGTLLYALGIGPLAHFFVPRFALWAPAVEVEALEGH
ncbi:MAG: YczE/YyaS/YitT family protein [Solirubrobacteraceae bacterium]